LKALKAICSANARAWLAILATRKKQLPQFCPGAQRLFVDSMLATDH